MPLVFDPPLQLQAVGRSDARWCMQHPLNRERYYVLKYASGSGLWLQIREPTGWTAETQIFNRAVTIFSSPIMTFNSIGDLMVLFHGQDPTFVTAYVYAYFLSSDGSVTSTTPISAAKNVISGMQELDTLGLTCKDGLDFYAAWQENNAGSIGHIWVSTFDGLARTWSAKAALGDPSTFGVSGVVLKQHPKDGTMHIGALMRAGGAAADLYYYNDRQLSWTPIHQLGGGSSQSYYYLDMDVDPRFEERVHLVGDLRRLSGGPVTDSHVYYFQRNIGGAWSTIPESLETAANLSASMPSIECDYNGDLYLLWREWDAGTSRMAVLVKRRNDINMLWDPTVKVADSILNNTNDPNGTDPVYPGIIRTPCTEAKIGNFCVTWGDNPTAIASEIYVYVSCSFVRSLEITQSLTALYALNAIYKDDLLISSTEVGPSWSRWKGAGARPLNAIRFLTLDPVLDNGELTYATADSNGAWVNQLKYEPGNGIDVDVAYQMLWTTKKFQDPIPSVPKVWRYVKLRAVNIVDPVTFTWRTDGTRASGTFVVRRDGWQVFPLPASAQGRVFELEVSLTASGIGPIGGPYTPEFHDMQVEGWAKRFRWTRRPI